MQIVVATHNAKKRAEIAAILGQLAIDVVPEAQTKFVEVIEDGDSFAANARKKAEAFVQANGLPALADDSGLCVDALGGAPGIYSARFAGLEGDDAANNRKLLQELAGKEPRTAHFTCALHLAFPDHQDPIAVEGRVAGEILHAPCGDTGFGYDPLFFCPELGKAFAEATAEEKATVSHRGRALRALVAQLQSNSSGEKI